MFTIHAFHEFVIPSVLHSLDLPHSTEIYLSDPITSASESESVILGETVKLFTNNQPSHRVDEMISALEALGFVVSDRNPCLRRVVEVDRRVVDGTREEECPCCGRVRTVDRVRVIKERVMRTHYSNDRVILKYRGV
jgi:hypothetical protein